MKIMGELDNSSWGDYDFYLLTKPEVKQAVSIISAMGYVVGQVNFDACRVSVRTANIANVPEEMKKIKAALETA